MSTPTAGEAVTVVIQDARHPGVIARVAAETIYVLAADGRKYQFHLEPMHQYGMTDWHEHREPGDVQLIRYATPYGQQAAHAELHAAYVTAREEAKAAEQRLREASNAMRAAQCGEHYNTTEAPGGRRTLHFCTLPKNHDGDHGKYPA